MNSAAEVAPPKEVDAREYSASWVDAFHRLRMIPGVGKILALTIRELRHFDRVDEFVSLARLLKCEHGSAGKKKCTRGARIGNLHLKWAFSPAAVEPR